MRFIITSITIFLTSSLIINKKCKKLLNHRNEMIKRIKYTGGNWPTTNETLVNNYLQIFVKFVKSIDFTDLQ